MAPIVATAVQTVGGLADLFTMPEMLGLLILGLGATLGNTFPSFVDVAKRLDPSGKIAPIAEVLSKHNPILEDIPYVEGNLTTGHRFTSRLALPTVTWRKLNQGVDPTKSRVEQVDETCGMAEAYLKVDVDAADLNGNSREFMASEASSVISSFNIEMAKATFYHSTKANPERPHGLTPRLDATTDNPASTQIIKADSGASGNDQTSIWLINWSPETVFGIFPKGSKAGLTMEDLGRQLVEDADGKTFTALVSRWQWKFGLCVRDFRYLARVCNIDTSAWKADLSAGADLALVMQDAIAAIFDPGVNLRFYMNRDAFNMLNKQLVKREANYLQWIDAGGRRIPSFLGIPIRITDAITKTESVVS